MKSLSHVGLFVTPWTAASQAPPFMGFSRQEYWSGVPFPSLGDLPDSGIESRSPSLQAAALPSKQPGKPLSKVNVLINETLENSSILFCEDTVKESHLWTRKRALTKNQMCQCVDLKLFSPQNCEK